MERYVSTMLHLLLWRPFRGRCATRDGAGVSWRYLCFAHILVFPAASKPSINSRISFSPKILCIILEMLPPIAAVSTGCGAASVLVAVLLDTVVE